MSLQEATDATIEALREHCIGLETLDISFCRQISEDALGVYVDSAKNLKTLVLWGCTQVCIIGISMWYVRGLEIG